MLFPGTNRYLFISISFYILTCTCAALPSNQQKTSEAIFLGFSMGVCIYTKFIYQGLQKFINIYKELRCHLVVSFSVKSNFYRQQGCWPSHQYRVDQVNIEQYIGQYTSGDAYEAISEYVSQVTGEHVGQAVSQYTGKVTRQ